MNHDLIPLLICGACGCVLGAIIGVLVMAALSARSAARASKDAWRAANLYYTRKEAR